MWWTENKLRRTDPKLKGRKYKKKPQLRYKARHINISTRELPLKRRHTVPTLGLFLSQQTLAPHFSLFLHSLSSIPQRKHRRALQVSLSSFSLSIIVFSVFLRFAVKKVIFWFSFLILLCKIFYVCWFVLHCRFVLVISSLNLNLDLFINSNFRSFVFLLFLLFFAC